VALATGPNDKEEGEGREAFKSVLVQAQTTTVHNKFICITFSKYSCVSAMAENLPAVKLEHTTVIPAAVLLILVGTISLINTSYSNETSILRLYFHNRNKSVTKQFHECWYRQIKKDEKLEMSHVKHSGLGSVVGIANGYGLDGPGIEFRWGAIFSAPVQTGPRAHPVSCTMVTRSLTVWRQNYFF